MPFENSLAETKQSAKTVLRDTTIKACQMRLYVTETRNLRYTKQNTFQIWNLNAQNRDMIFFVLLRIKFTNEKGKCWVTMLHIYQNLPFEPKKTFHIQ